MQKRISIAPVLMLFAANFLWSAIADSLAPIQFKAPPRDFTCSGISLASGDFNQDGVSDLTCLGYANTVLLGNGHGGFQPAIPFPCTAGGPIIVGDLNGDGKPLSVQTMAVESRLY